MLYNIYASLVIVRSQSEEIPSDRMSCKIHASLVIVRSQSEEIPTGCYVRFMPLWLLGDSGGVVNSLDFCPASLKSLGCFYFRCVLSSQWQAVTVNLRILHCQL